jgi:HTH-type transcriptional regulator/antitoxin HigA
MTLALNQNIDNQLLTKFQPKIIENEEEYEQARHLLLNLISKQDRLPEETAQEVLLHLMSANNMKQADLVGKIGSKGVVSEIVNGKRSISKAQGKILGEIFNVSPSVFI